MATSGKHQEMDVVLQGIGIVLRKLFNKDEAKQLALVLQRNGAFTEASCEKVLGSLAEGPAKSHPEGINASKEMNLETFEVALEEEDFPGDSETKELLHYVLRRSGPELNTMLQNWEVMEQNKNMFEGILGLTDVEKYTGTENGTKRVKNLIIIAMIKLGHCDEKERQAAKSIIEILRGAVDRDTAEVGHSRGSSGPKSLGNNLGKSDSGTTVDSHISGAQKRPNIGGILQAETYADKAKKGRMVGEKSDSRHSGGIAEHCNTSAHEDKDDRAEGTATSSRSQTRSETSKEVAGSTVSTSPPKESSKSGTSVFPMPPDIHSVEESFSVFEFRVVVDDSASLPTDVPLKFNCDAFDWLSAPLTMQYNNKRRFFFCRIMCSKNCTIYLKYKFSYRCFNPALDVMETNWEVLPKESHDGIFVNREIKLSGVQTSPAVITHVCFFDHTSSWAEQCCMGMEKFLPSLEHIGQSLGSGDMFGTTSEMDIFSWINCIRMGWRTQRGYTTDFNRPQPAIYEKVLIEWMNRLVDAASNNSEDVKSLILIALAVASAFAFEKLEIKLADLLDLLFTLMSTNKLTADDCKHLHDTAMDKYQFFKGRGLDVPAFPEAIQWLYKQILRKKNLTWIVSLPLYWLMAGGKTEKKMQKAKTKKEFLLSKACLPLIPQLDWLKVCKEYMTTSLRSELLQQAETVLEMSDHYPCIINTFQFMLTNQEVVSMMLNKEKNMIVTLFPVECVLFQYLEASSKITNKKEKETCVKFISEQIDEKMKAASESRKNLKERLEQLKVCTMLIKLCNSHLGRFIRTTGSRLVRNEDVVWCLDAVASKVVSWASILKQDLESMENFTVAFDEMLDLVQNGVANKQVSRNEVEYWQKLFSVEWKLEDISRVWKMRILQGIQKAVDKHYLFPQTGKVNCENYLKFYVNQLEGIDLHSDVEKCFNEKAYRCAEQLLETCKKGGFLKSFLGIFGRGTKDANQGIISIFGKLFQKEYQICKNRFDSESTASLYFLCGWSFASDFYQLFDKERRKNFSPEVQKSTKAASSKFKEIAKMLSKTDINVEHLEIILENRDRFLALCDVLVSKSKKNEKSSNDDIQQHHMTDVIRTCEEYLNTFKSSRKIIDDFVLVCSHIQFGDAPMPYLQLKRRAKTDVQQMKILDLVELGPNGKPGSYKFLGVTAEQLEQLRRISFLKDSKVFREMFGKPIADDQQKPLKSLTDILLHWQHVQERIFTLVKQVNGGTIALGAVSTHFGSFDGNRTEIQSEVEKLYHFHKNYNPKVSDEPVGNPPLIETRINQIVNIFKLGQGNSAFGIVLELKNILKLNGDFSDIMTRKKMMKNQEDTALADAPCQLEIATLDSFSPERLTTLKNFMEAESVIEWLQEKMNDMNEVKVMCDLAMISAGEDAIEVDRVSNMLSAVMGFAPLIFWSETERDKAGSGELLDRCKKVWENQKGTKNLLQKWNETKRQLNWFKEVENFYGSVEKSSLTRAQEINDRGKYTITKPSENKPLTVENCLKLTIPAKEGDEEKDTQTCVSVEELRELQSKLMLIAGEAEKGRQDVNLFAEVLTSVQKLADAYVLLETSGCMLFAEWEAVVRCHSDPDRANTDNLSINIKFTDKAPPIIGFGSHAEIDRLADILKTCHEKWQDHMSSERMGCYFLNEYNVRQTVYLCRELAELDAVSTISVQVHMLLTFVRKDFSVDDLKACLQDARIAIDIARKSDVEDNNSCNDSTESTDGSSNLQQAHDEGEGTRFSVSVDNSKLSKEMVKAVHTLIKEDGVAENIAKAAVQAEGCDDLASCRSWVMLNELEEELVEKYSFDFNNNYDFDNKDGEIEVVQSVFECSKSGDTLAEVICRLHENLQQTDEGNFLAMTNTICGGFLDETVKMDLQDYLSLHLLGQFLANLSQENTTVRKLLPGLHQGKPNLLLCSEEEILPTVLSLYMHSNDQPLPSRSEVLICSEETTNDEVERFLRRAMRDSGRGGQILHTLAFADKLTYRTASAVEDVFNTLLKNGKSYEEYQLVILLSKQQHYLHTCFEKYLVDGKWNQPTEKIQSYLKGHLEVGDVLKTSTAAVSDGNYTVKVITSNRSGVGKSLHAQRLREKLQETIGIENCSVSIRLLENMLDIDYVIQKLDRSDVNFSNEDAVMVHIDITPAAQHGIEAFAFNLFVLGTVQGSDGKVWKTHPSHLYVVETTDFGVTGEKRFSKNHILSLLPCIKCYAPRDLLNTKQFIGEWLAMDEVEFRSETFQRPFQYLSRYEKRTDLDTFFYTEPEGTPDLCIEVLLRHCCIENPSWAQLRHFCSFLNIQLKNCEKSIFCSNPHVKQDLLGLKLFAVKFMIRMAQDFATPSLEISDKSVKDNQTDAETNRRDFAAHQIRRRWEETSHPYVFFNEDGQTMTFINVRINQSGYLLDRNGFQTEQITTPELVAALKRQEIDLNGKFDDFDRTKKLQYLCQVMGIKAEENFDPDPTYELTTDNVLKILAIYMRFRCQIPVIIMGETGCGKTRLVEFMSRLKAGTNVGKDVQNMITLKIHGGITVQDIHKSVEEAKMMASLNHTSDNFTVLFYDEANTTEAIYAIKEVVCDKSIDGTSFDESKLQIIAACNPYKKLSAEAVQKLEDSGLGYRIRTSKTAHLFGNIPVRSLVYRVVALPPSLQPFVWDFGQLNDDAEKIYIQQMAMKLGRKLSLSQRTTAMINNVLSSCQSYMRGRTDECRYVSLRDVERCMITYEWFHNHRSTIFPAIEHELKGRLDPKDLHKIEPDIRTLIQTLGVCYHAALDDRKPFRAKLAECLDIRGIDEKYIKVEMASCQAAFVRNIHIGQNIARNEALQENVFMMAICADMRIPLFLIGKPGSSKSLAKTIVTGNMQGERSPAPLYQSLKEIHILSYQCSDLTDADGIKRVFKQCVQLQKKGEANTYTAVVVLDEIGLAEDSPNMPLKVLHPLLEGRGTDLTAVANPDEERVGFIGISNWALDPAKMNRGIFLTRNKPSKDDLITTGKEITKTSLWISNEDLFEKLTITYLKVYTSQKVEYFGLRDYYSLMKMICSRSRHCEEKVKFDEAVYAILRNFSGGETSVVSVFLAGAKKALQLKSHEKEPLIQIQDMIRDNLQETDSRFLLLLVNEFSAVSLVESFISSSARDVQVVFGSSFPGDHSYTEICRNINRIKVCMETGKTVILLNMSKIHESLYDALNQHFVTCGGQNYVDLGLGGHRVKCRIANDFRLLVIEKKEEVYRKYPIPLINRLEKHHFHSKNLLDEVQRFNSDKLEEWTSDFTNNQALFSCRHAFVGFHADTISSVVLTTEGNLEECKEVLLESCSVDAILRLPGSNFNENEVEHLQDVYFNQQCHDELGGVLKMEIEKGKHLSVLEVTSFSSVLSKKDIDQLASELNVSKRNLVLIPLEQFYSQQEYCDRLEHFFERCNQKAPACAEPFVLLIQCAQSQKHSAFIACARHCLMNKIREIRSSIPQSEDGFNVTVAFLLSAERRGTAPSKSDIIALQPNTETKILHVDEMRPSDGLIAPASKFFTKSLHQVFESAMQGSLDEGNEQALINIQSLLLSCVYESVAKVKDQYAGSERYLKRVEILVKLCESEGATGKHFRRILLKKLVDLYSCDEMQLDWIAERACDRESLQEAGTFKKTLWICLKGHVSNFLAYVVSVVDQHNNLDFALKDSRTQWEQDMWLGMLDLLEISWQDLRNPTKFAISSPIGQRSCQLPFSFTLINCLKTEWNATKALKRKQNAEDITCIFGNRKMRKVAAEALTTSRLEVMKSFIADLIERAYKPAVDAEVEIQLAENALFDISMKNFMKARKEPNFEIGDEIAIIFFNFKTMLMNLETFSEILRGFPQVLENQKAWSEKQSNSDRFVLHILAFSDVLGILEEMTESIEKPDICVEWMNLARIAKLLYDSISRDARVDTLADIDSKWTQILLLDLLLSQLLPAPCSDHTSSQQYTEVVAHHARSFWKCSAKADIRSSKFLRVILMTMKRCCEDVRLKLLVNWKEDCACKICRKKVRDPTFLPCGHFGCEVCVKRHAQPGERCVGCNEEISDDFVPIPASLSDDEEQILEKMKSNCTSFYLEYLRKFCFEISKGMAKSMKTEIQQILKDFVVQLSDVDKKTLDPTTLDLNINTKSSILQILLRYDHQFVSEEVNRWLGELVGEMKISFITILLATLEERCVGKSSVFWQNKENVTKFWENRVDDTWSKLTESEESELSIETLQKVSELRCALSHYVSLINDLQGPTVKGVEVQKSITEDFIRHFTDILKSDEMPQVVKEYVMKVGCRKFGTEWLFQVAEHKTLREIIPMDLRQSAAGCKIDHWSLIGREYTDTKSELYQTKPEDCGQAVKDILDRNNRKLFPYLLATISWNGDNCEEMRNVVTDVLEQYSGPYDFLIKFMTKHENALKSALKISTASSKMAETLYQLIVLFIAATAVKDDILKCFNEILNNPKKTSDLFLPAMPEDVYFATPADFRLEVENKSTMYTCPNGHLYSIDDCHQPYHLGKCSECYEVIGGQNSKLAKGNKRIVKKANSQSGYLFSDGGIVSTGSERMTPQGVAVTRFILHSCLFAAAMENPEVISSILNCGDSVRPEKYLSEQLQNNLRDLSKSLARNVDDAVLVLHNILLRILHQGATSHTENWTTLDSRKQWEQKFRKDYLLPVFRNLEMEIADAAAILWDVKETGKAQLSRLIQEISLDEKVDHDTTNWKNAHLWAIIEHPNSLQLLQVLQDRMDPQTGEILQIILHTPDLQFLKYLENVLSLQQRLTENYRHRIDMKDADQITLRNHIENGGQSDQKPIDKYIVAWNEVLQHGYTFASESISLDSPLSVVLPSTKGSGRRAKMLAEYIIDIQNQFLAKCKRAMKSDHELKEVDVHQLKCTDFVCFDKQKDLLNLIKMNTSYAIKVDERGRHHVITYNIEALEKQVREKFVLCKKLIDRNTVPCMRYPQDVGIGPDWKKVKSETDQGPLTAKLSQDIDRIVERSHSSELCEAVRTLTNAISFLAMVNADSSKSLCEFLEMDLRIPATSTSMMPRSALISHVLSLYQRMSWHKSVIFARQGLNPYKEALSGIEQEEIAGEILKKTNDALEHTDVTIFQQRMNEMLITGTGVNNSDWGLKEDVFPNLEFLDGNEDQSWYSKIPEELQMRHINHLFVLSTNVKNVKQEE